MKAAELRQKDVAGVKEEIKALQLGNTGTLSETRRSIARAKTILAQKQAAK
jgi:large subunit ribosomal protein L29